MSLTVKHLNADTTFLLSFSPAFAPADKVAHFPGSFTILIDPWLAGHSSILHPTFQISNLTTAPSITSLADLKEQPDLILISQDKPDHCHRETLCSLPKETSTNILATPAAAKKIRSWGHFDADRIYELEAWNERTPDTIVNIILPGFSANSADGLVTIASLVTKRDLTGLHSAVGITYQAPGTFARNAKGQTVDLFDTFSANGSAASHNRRTSIISTGLPQSTERPESRRDSALSGVPSERKAEQSTLSVLYSPHGVSPSLVEPYATQHLAPMKALPLTALFHSLNTEDNLWFMGGRVVAGTPGGVELVRKLGAKHWISAHDEVKVNKGLATLFIKSRAYGVDEVEEVLQRAGKEVEDAPPTKVHVLGAGERMRIER